jgi:signal peptidase II
MMPWLVIAATVLASDQLTKWFIKGVLQTKKLITVTSYFNLVLVYNKGAAFSFLASAGGWQRYFFIAFSIVVILGILYFLRRNASQRLFCFSLSLILGGAIGNLIDRVIYGQVIDFLDFHIRGWHWPAFNVADAAITVGAILLVLDEFRRVKRNR